MILLHLAESGPPWEVTVDYAPALTKLRFAATLRRCLLLMFSAYCIGCAAHPSPFNVSLPQVAQQPAPYLQLPRPSDIGRGAAESPGNEDLYCDGASSYESFPSQRAVPEGTVMRYTPDWQLGEATSPDRLAFAAYCFSNVCDYSGPHIIRLHWQTPPVESGTAYLAVADFVRDAWRWYSVPTSGTVELAAMDSCISSDGELISVVLLTGTDEAILGWIIIGERLAPVARLATDLNPDPSLNVPPLTVTFDGSESYVLGGEIVAWDFDFEDNASWDLLGSSTGIVKHTYNTPGSMRCRMRIHDDGSQQSEVTVEFRVVNPSNVPPTARFIAMPQSGPAPLLVIFDATDSSDDSGIQLYEWDLDGDGEYERTTGDLPFTNYTFEICGVNDVGLRVTDLDFATATCQGQITVTGGFDYVVVDSSAEIDEPVSAATGCIDDEERACVAWQEVIGKNLLFAIATNSQGSAYSIPTYPAPIPDDAGYSPSLFCEEDGRPIIA
jgi:hypothetical protein